MTHVTYLRLNLHDKVKIFEMDQFLQSLITSLVNAKSLSKFILAVKTLSVDRFSKFLQVILGQTKTEILTSKHFVYRPPY